MARALNIKISDDLYNQLHHRAKNSDCTKTEIVETALHRLFNDTATDVDSGVDDVGNTATSVDAVTDVDDVDDKVTNVDKLIQQYLESYLEGVSCQLPTNVDSGVDSGVDSNVDNVDSGVDDVDSGVDSGVDSNVDNVDSGVDDVDNVDSGVDDVDNVDSGVDSNVDDVDTTPKTLKVSQLAKRLMISDKQIYAAAKNETYIIGTPPNASQPEKWDYIPNSKPKQFKLIERSG